MSATQKKILSKLIGSVASETAELPVSAELVDAPATYTEESATETKNGGEAAPATSTLFVNCAAIKGEFAQLSDKLAPGMTQIAEAKRVPHIGLVPFGEGWEMLNAYIMELPMNSLGDCFVDGRSTLYAKCSTAIISRFSRVVVAY